MSPLWPLPAAALLGWHILRLFIIQHWFKRFFFSFSYGGFKTTLCVSNIQTFVNALPSKYWNNARVVVFCFKALRQSLLQVQAKIVGVLSDLDRVNSESKSQKNVIQSQHSLTMEVIFIGLTSSLQCELSIWGQRGHCCTSILMILHICFEKQMKPSVLSTKVERRSSSYCTGLAKLSLLSDSGTASQSHAWLET